MSRPNRDSRSRFAARAPRPRPRIGQPRTTEPMVRPLPRTVLRRFVASGKLAALVLLIAGVWGFWYAFRSPLFIVQQLEITGLRAVDAATVNELAAVEGVSIWQIKPAEVAARIAQNTYVATATVNLLLPARVLVNVQEREAAIVWNTSGVNYEVTADGAVLGASRELTTTNLVVYDTRPIALAAGERVDSDALSLAQTLHLRVPTEIGWQPTRYEWDPYYGFSIYDGQRQIVFGRMQDPDVPFETKLATLRALQAENTGWIFLDLRPTKPYYRTPAPTATATP